MNPTDDLTKRLSAMLASTAPTREPERLYGAVLDATRGVSQRPRLLARSALAPVATPRPASSRTAFVGVAALLMLGLAVGLAVMAGARPGPTDLLGVHQYTGFGTSNATWIRFTPGAGTAAVLADGRVLIVECDRAAAFVIDGASRRHSGSFAGEPVDPCRASAAAALLADGRVLIAGSAVADASAADAEVYDPALGTFTRTGSMLAGRFGMQATTLADGRVLITGGSMGGPAGGFAVDTAELYDPLTGTFSATGLMTRTRETHEALLLPDGRVLLAGGTAGEEGTIDGTLEAYDPVTGTFTVVGSMGTPRDGATATILADGRVLIAGGRAIVDGNEQVSDVAEIFDPRTDTVTATGPMLQPRFMHAAASLADGRVLVVGGDHSWGLEGNRSLVPVADTEIYDPVTGSFSAADSMSEARLEPLALRLGGPEVMVLGARPWRQASADATATYEVFR